jgi:hypothetical protein
MSCFFAKIILLEKTSNILYLTFPTRGLIVPKSVSKRALKLRKIINIYSENIYSVLTCHNVTKHTVPGTVTVQCDFRW